MTYAFRFTFHVYQEGMLTGEDAELIFKLPNGKDAKIAPANGEKFSTSTKFVITSGGYASREEAMNCATKLKESVLYFGAKHRMGVDTGKNIARFVVSKIIKEMIIKEQGVRLVEEIHGITVHDEEYPTQIISSSTASLFNPRGRDFFIEETCNIMSTMPNIDNKTKLAMELLTASYFEYSQRSRFLTLVLATEALLEPAERPDHVKQIIDELMDHVDRSYLAVEEKQSIRGTLHWLYKDSISLSLRKMADLLPDQNFQGLSPKKFINKCYEVRSRLVHTGEVDESKDDIGTLSASLEVYVSLLLTKICSI